MGRWIDEGAIGTEVGSSTLYRCHSPGLDSRVRHRHEMLRMLTSVWTKAMWDLWTSFRRTLPPSSLPKRSSGLGADSSLPLRPPNQCVTFCEPNDSKSPARKLPSIGPEGFIFPSSKGKATKQTKPDKPAYLRILAVLERIASSLYFERSLSQ